MQWLLFGLVVLLACIFLHAWFRRLQPETKQKYLRILGIFVVIAVTLFLVVTGKWQFLWVSFLSLIPWARRLFFLLPLLQRLRHNKQIFRFFRPRLRTIHSKYVEVQVDKNQAVYEGVITNGVYFGQKFSQIPKSDISKLYVFLGQNDSESTHYYAKYLARIYGPEWKTILNIAPDEFSTQQSGARSDRDTKKTYGQGATDADFTHSTKKSDNTSRRTKRGVPHSYKISRADALRILDLDGNPSRKTINQAFFRLMKSYHPDIGGSNDVAARLNQARQVLLNALNT